MIQVSQTKHENTDRAQAHTLEAVAAAAVLLASVGFALQVTAVTPLTASTSSQHIENQEGAVAAGVLAAAEANGTLRETVLYWNASGWQFWNADFHGRYANGGPPTAFGETLDRAFLDRGIAVNVYLYYVQSDGDRRRHRLLHLGQPTEHAVTASRTVTLYDDDRLYRPNGSSVEPYGGTLTEVAADPNKGFYVPDAAAGGVYNTVEVEVTVWRM